MQVNFSPKITPIEKNMEAYFILKTSTITLRSLGRKLTWNDFNQKQI